MHCAVVHWATLSNENMVSMTSWIRHMIDCGRDSLLETVDRMMDGSLPAERGAFVVAGAAFPNNARLRNWLLLRLSTRTKRTAEDIIAAIYGLAAHLDQDENLTDKLTLFSLKIRQFQHGAQVVTAINKVLSIWLDAQGSGRCGACGKVPGSLLIPKLPA